MASKTSSRTGIGTTNVQTYKDFSGLDTSRDETALDTPERLHFTKLENCYCDAQGQIIRESPAHFRKGDFPITHMKFLDKDRLVWAEERGGAVFLNSDEDHEQEAYTSNSVVSTTAFNRMVHFTSPLQRSFYYDGIVWKRNQSFSMNEIMRPAYFTAVQRRMIAAGVAGQEQDVYLSRVDEHEVWPDDELSTDTSALRAGKISIKNIVGSAGRITGIAPFEQTKLAVFTEDRTFLYDIDPDIAKWIIDSRTSINIGCISHNTIQSAGTDLLYCSRSGVHTVHRSEDNGILVMSQSLSEKINALYRSFLVYVDNPETVSAIFDQDNKQYHIYFPVTGGITTQRLTLNFNTEANEGRIKWSTGTYLNVKCGAFYGGRLVVGTGGGAFNVDHPEDIKEDSIAPEMTAVTPLLWLKDLENTKEAQSLTIVASGPGELEVYATDEENRELGSWVMEISGDSDDNRYIGVPLSKQYHRQFNARFRGLRLRFKAKSKGLVRIVGFIVKLR